MIKCNHEKQDEILRHLKEFVSDVGNYVTNSREEFALIRETVQQFKTLNEEYKRNLESLTKNLNARLEKTIFSTKSPARAETKRTYSSLLRFTFTQFSAYFAEFVDRFDALHVLNPDNFLKNASEFASVSLAELVSATKTLRDELGAAETQRALLETKRKDYFDHVHTLSLNKLYSFKCLRLSGDKDMQKLGALEWSYLRQFVTLNKHYARVREEFERTRNVYEQNIRQKFILIYAKVGMALKNDSDTKYAKFEETVRNYALSFVEIPSSIWLSNVSRLFESYFPLDKLILYRSKLELDSMKSLVRHITSLQEETPREVVDQANIIATVIILDLCVRGEYRYLKEYLTTASTDVLLIVLLKVKLFVKYENELLFVTPETMGLIRVLIESGLRVFNGEEHSDAMMEILRLAFYLGTKIYLARPRNGADSPHTPVEDSMLHVIRELPVFQVMNFWRTYSEVLFYRLNKFEGSAKARTINIAEKIMYLNFFFHADINIAQTFVEALLVNANVNFRIIRNTALMKLATTIHKAQRHSLEDRLVFAREDKVRQVLDMTVRLGYLPPTTLLLSRPLWRRIRAIALHRELMKPGTPLLTRRQVWLRACGGTACPRERLKTLRREQVEQVNIDVIRTKQVKGEAYQRNLESIIVEFFECTDEPLEYFQGFNYITSFLFDFFENRDHTLVALHHLRRTLIADFFTDNLCVKLNLLHFQLNHLVQEFFPNLSARWRNSDMGSEIFFSSFLISLFTSYSYSDSRFLFEFWDVIMAERWQGVIKCVIFVIQANLSDLLVCESSETIRFFSEAHMDKSFVKKFSASEFKKFVISLRFDEELFRKLEHKFKEVRGTISRLESL